MNRAKAATAALAIPATLALGVSAYTSYLYFGERLGITGWERLPLCGTGEAAILALSVYAWATGRRGVALLAYALVLVQGIPAFDLSGGPGGIVRIVLGPVLLAAVLHLSLGLEVRLAGARKDTLLRRAWAEARERLTSYLGIGRRGEDSAAIARSRAADQAVAMADLVAAKADKPASHRYRRRAARLADAIDAARHGLDAEGAALAEEVIVGRIIRRKSVGELASITARHDWTAAVPNRDATSRNEVPAERSEHAPVPTQVLNETGAAGRNGTENRMPELVPNATEPVSEPVHRTGGTANLGDRAMKKNQQINAVLNLITELGYDAVNLPLVMKRTGMPKTTAHHRLKEAREAWNQSRTGQAAGTETG